MVVIHNTIQNKKAFHKLLPRSPISRKRSNQATWGSVLWSVLRVCFKVSILSISSHARWKLDSGSIDSGWSSLQLSSHIPGKTSSHPRLTEFSSVVGSNSRAKGGWARRRCHGEEALQSRIWCRWRWRLQSLLAGLTSWNTQRTIVFA